MRAERSYWPVVPERIWDSILAEFTLPTSAELEAHFQVLNEPDAMRRAVRVFIGEGTFCPGFQLKNGLFNEPVLDLFQQALALKVPHNVFRLDGGAAARGGWRGYRAGGSAMQHSRASECFGCVRGQVPAGREAQL